MGHHLVLQVVFAGSSEHLVALPAGGYLGFSGQNSNTSAIVSCADIIAKERCF